MQPVVYGGVNDYHLLMLYFAHMSNIAVEMYFSLDLRLEPSNSNDHCMHQKKSHFNEFENANAFIIHIVAKNMLVKS